MWIRTVIGNMRPVSTASSACVWIIRFLSLALKCPFHFPFFLENGLFKMRPFPVWILYDDTSVRPSTLKHQIPNNTQTLVEKFIFVSIYPYINRPKIGRNVTKVIEFEIKLTQKDTKTHKNAKR